MSTELHDKLHQTAARPTSGVDMAAINTGIRRRKTRRLAVATSGALAAVVVGGFLVLAQGPAAPQIDHIGPGESEPQVEQSEPTGEPQSMTASQLEEELERVTAEMDDVLSRLNELRTREADLVEQQSEGADVSDELDAVSAEIYALEKSFADLANQQFALQVQLVELGALEDPYVEARLAVTDDDRQLVQHLTGFARDFVTYTLNRELFVEELAVGVGREIAATRDRQDVDLALSTYYAPASVSVLELLAQNRPRQILVGDHPHCAGAPKPPPEGFEEHRRVSVQPIDTATCLQWWTVDLFINDDGLIEAVTLDQWEF